MKWKTKALDISAIIIIIFGLVFGVLSLETPKKTITTVTEQVPQVKNEQKNDEESNKDNKEVSTQDSAPAATQSTNSQTTKTETSTPTTETNSSKSNESSTPASTNNSTQTTSNSTSKLEEPKQKVVNISVKGYDGYSISKTELQFKEGSTAFSALEDLSDLKKISLDYMGSGRYLYVQGINGQMEKDKGATSGWIYSINGVTPNVSSGDFDIKEGDVIEWIYKES
jgi:glucan-binding YG repeat protein